MATSWNIYLNHNKIGIRLESHIVKWSYTLNQINLSDNKVIWEIDLR
jgi:hypothetical protein